MLAVTAGDGACGENSTQPTARVSTLTALDQKQRVRDSGDSRDGAIILPPAPETDHLLSASLGQLAELSGELVPHSNIVKSFQFYSARQHADQALPDAHKPYFVALLIPTIAMLCDLYRPPPLIGSTR
jgi:hypothetical protein